MNSITEFLDLEDVNIVVEDISISGTTKTITLSTLIQPRFCPACQSRMHSRGIKQRTIQHPVLQDGYQVLLILKQRRWRCTNDACRFEENESFRFVNKRRRSTNATDMMIVQAFRDFSTPAAEIARRFHTTDTHVNDIFDRYVRLSRLPLTDIISVDEVNLDMDFNCKYALVIQDFYTGDPIDLLISRRTEVTEPYFNSIPREERDNVKYLICDMYNPYINFVNKFFHKAVPVVDSFHVVQWMIHQIDGYIRQLVKKFKQRDLQQYLASHPEGLKNYEKVPLSNEIYLLTRYRWLVLQNSSNIKYHSDARMDRHFHCLMNTYDYEDALFRIDARLRGLRDLKEQYVSFNSRYFADPTAARPKLEKLIDMYRSSHEPIFVAFAKTLEDHKDYIINSFVMVKKVGPGGLYDARLSNGPIESLNRVPKDMKRNGRGYQNFDHFRNRFLYGTRHNPVLDGTSQAVSVRYDMQDDYYSEDDE